MDRPRRDSRHHNGITLRGVSQPTFATKSATSGHCWRYRMLSFEMVVEKLVQAVTCIVRCRAIVFQSVIKNHPAGVELRVVESMVCARINDELDWWPVVAPAGNLVGTVCRRRPIVAGPNENERGYSRTRPRPPTWRIKRSRRPKASYLVVRTVRTNWAPPQRGRPERLPRSRPQPHGSDRRSFARPGRRAPRKHPVCA